MIDLNKKEALLFKREKTSVKISAFSSQGEYITSFSKIKDAAQSFLTGRHLIRCGLKTGLPVKDIFWVYE